MEKTEGSKKTVIVVDEQGLIYESTYPKRAKGLVKSGRARYVDENTICLACPPKENILEEKKMNDNNNKNINNNVINEQYILQKIDEIIAMNKEAINNPGLANMSVVPGSKNPIQSICETNNKMIDLLSGMLQMIKPQVPVDNTSLIIEKLTNSLNEAIFHDANEDVIYHLTQTIIDLKK